MYDYKEPWKIKIAAALNAVMSEAGINGNITPEQIIAETPPSPEMGDIGFPMFGFAKTLRKGPPQIAQIVSAKVTQSLQAETGIIDVRSMIYSI